MANFKPAFEKMIENEGGYVLHEVAGDRGGKTYAGISYRAHPDWEGWGLIPSDSDRLTQLVYDFYKRNYWDRVKGDDIRSQDIAASIFDFAVNAGVKTASRLAQVIVSASPDGIIGQNTVAKLNEYHPNLFVPNYALAKIARYANIVTKNPSQRKFLLGWVNRTLEGLK